MVKGEGYVTMETNEWTNKQTSEDRATQLIDTGIWVSQLKGWRCIFVVHKSSASKEFSWSRSFSPSRWVRWCKVTCWFLTQYWGTKHGFDCNHSYPQVTHWLQRPISQKSQKETPPFLSISPLIWYPPNSTFWIWSCPCRWIGFPRVMCFQQGPGQIGLPRICGRLRFTLSMAPLLSTSQVGGWVGRGVGGWVHWHLILFTGGNVLLWAVHRVHVGVAVSQSGSPWGPYIDPKGILHDR